MTRRLAVQAIAASGATLSLPSQVLSAPQPSGDVAAQLDAMAWNLLALKPERATSKGVDKGAHAALRGRVEDRSIAGQRSIARQLRKDLTSLERIDTTRLDPARRTDVEVVRSAYATALDGFALPYGDVAVGDWRNAPYVVIQNAGAYLDVPRMLGADQPVADAADLEAFLARLGAFGEQLDGETERTRAAAQAGLIPPDFLLGKTLTQLQATLADARAPDGGTLVKAIGRRKMDVPGRWELRARELVIARVVPALERQIAEIERQRPRATSAPGMRERPHGEAYYAWALRASTTTRMMPEEIHQLGVQQLAEIHARMDPLLRQLGYTSGTVAERAIALQRDPRFAYPTGDAGRKAIVAAMEERLAFIRTRLPRAFRRVVDAKVEIRRLPEAEEAGAPPAYGGPGSIDGSIPGRIWVNLGDTTMHNKANIGDLVFHEGVPGHVYQGNYTLSQPLIRSILAFNAYSEGWALYAEQLADELGAYDGDPAGQVGYLSGLAWRAVRLVIDTGIHAKGWSREQARQAFVQATGLPVATAASEVDRYCSWPGQACGYKVGHNEINRQRDRARTALGARYDLRDFDQAVVEGGNVPLDVLAGNVERYIAGAKQV
ncbi:uncharacterized protein (DUF885 family) [Novosphingobium chloroacetimidivorans]|uniref:Uncharacterized protein (DUF885 family) n=1 Tax=Novosphingobium chloroacetimidivorans TaxID=1428314 RepID=A0A7W7KA35_9SPHN|nr:DUF885 domain-containing protein [Novosphingobium chloroacetimidivorans]MBB4859017.1 uncharacterized protein (DUF885 family) [Novosphingobium chloroacetimidivorans]